MHCKEKNYDVLVANYLKQKNCQRFQQILDVVYFNYIIDYVDLNNDDVIGIICDKLYVRFNYVFGLMPNNIPEPTDIKQKRKDFDEKYPNIKLYSANVVNILYLNLLFELYYDKEKLPLPDLSDSNYNLYKAIAAIEKEQKYNDYLDEIHQMEEILNNCSDYPNLIDNKDDFATRNDKVVDYNKDRDTYIKFIKFITKLYNKQDSFVLRYINIDNLGMSSGERAIQNMFSWLISIPSFERILNDKKDTEIRKLLLLIDEIDLYAHPEWQRKIINYLLTVIETIDYEEIQIIISSHSPLILSDFPKCNIVFLHKDEQSCHSVVDDSVNHKDTLCANLYSLLNDSFFLNEGMVGEHSRNYILKIFEELKSGNKEHKDDFYEFIIRSIGDRAVKNEFLKIFNSNNNGIKQYEQLNHDKLNAIKTKLEITLQEIKNMMGE